MQYTSDGYYAAFEDGAYYACSYKVNISRDQATCLDKKKSDLYNMYMYDASGRVHFDMSSDRLRVWHNRRHLVALHVQN